MFGRKNIENTDINKKCYNKFTAYLFMNFLILGVGFGIIGPIVLAKHGFEVVLILLVIGVSCLFIALSYAVKVYMTGRRIGQRHFFKEFFIDSVIIWFKVFMVISIVLIPVALFLRSDGDWTYRKSVDGLDVMVRSNGEGEYEDAFGTKYKEKEE